MAKIGNEAKLILKLAKERMAASLSGWENRQHNPNSNSNDRNWLSGYKYCLQEVNSTIFDVVEELEQK